MSQTGFTKLPLSPGEFLAAQHRFLRAMYYDNHKVDIGGQLDAGQYATAAVLSVAALEQGIAVYLLTRGQTGLNAQNLWAMFRRERGHDDAIFDEAMELLFRNPLTDDEVRLYANDCIAFVEHRLGVQAGGYHSKESFAGYVADIEGIGRLVRLVAI